MARYVRIGVDTQKRGRSGEWRWMAGRIRQCPSVLGWLQPSAVIVTQTIPSGGFAGPDGALVERWWTELLLVAAVALGAAFWIVRSVRGRMDSPDLPAGASGR